MGGLRRTQGKYMSIIYLKIQFLFCPKPKDINLQLCKKQQIYTFVELESENI